MNVRPVTHYKTPHYPTKTDIQRNPQLLENIPSRWEKNRFAWTAFGMTLALSACSSYQGNPESEAGSDSKNTGYQETYLEDGQGESVPASKDSKAKESKAKETAVEEADAKETGQVNKLKTSEQTAPVFLHGVGVGSYGCVSVTSPYFLSEEEAFDIISAEAQSYGKLVFTKEEVPVLNKVNVPVTNIYMGVDENKEKFQTDNLETDGWNKDKQIAFEFVSSQDVENWTEDTGVWSSVSVYDMEQTAQDLRSGLESKKNSLTMGIFYDPCSSHYNFEKIDRLKETYGIYGDNPDYEGFEIAKEEFIETMRKQSEADLQLQVRDFIDWLKGQGVI